MVRRVILLVAAAVAISLLAYGEPAQATQPQTLATRVQTQAAGAIERGGFEVAWSHVGGRLRVSVSTPDAARTRADIGAARRSGIVHPMWWGCPELVIGALFSVGAVVIGILAAGGMPLDLGFLGVIGPRTLALIAQAMGGVGSLESIVAEYVC